MRNIRGVRAAAIILGLSFAGVLGGTIFRGGPVFRGVQAAPQLKSSRMGLPQDWSHRHVVFSSAPNMETLLAIRQDPRLLHQLLKRGFGLNRINVAATEEIRNSGQADAPVRSEEDTDSGNALAGSEEEDNNGGRTAPAHDWSVSLGAAGAHVPRSMYPAKYSFDVTAPPSCINDFVVFPTFNAGSAGQATIVAYNRLYSSQGGSVPAGICGLSGPSVKWAYNTGGGIHGSPTISLDGTKVAFAARTGRVVHVLTAGTTGLNGTSVTAPATPGVGNNAVDFNFPLSGAPTVGSSALFVDYGDDVAYVGDDAGVLHKINGIFRGVPAEVTTGGWPVTVHAGSALSGPVFDFITRNVFVTDASGRLSYVRDVGSTSGGCAAGAPPCRGAAFVQVSAGNAILDAPIVDSSTGRVFTETASLATTGNATIVQTNTALGSVVTVAVGPGDVANPLHNGDFDNKYLNNPSTGSYYVCGKAAGTTNPTLYSIGFNAAGVMKGAANPKTVVLARAPAECSPATEIFNTGSTPQKDWLFIGVSTRCAATGGIAGGCVMSYDITAGMPNTVTAKTAERNGVSGIIIDNIANTTTFPQASSIYFSDEGDGPCGDGINAGACAVKLTQAGLL